MRKIDRQWIIRAKYLRALGTVYSVTLSFFVALSLLFATLVGQMRAEAPVELSAATCSLPATVTTTIELTPDSADNVIDCTGQSIVIASTGKLIIKSYKTADSTSANDGGVVLKVADLTIQTGGEISADGQGYTPSATDGGSAAISTGVAAGSGGGHGGAGGTGNTVGGGGDVVGATGGTIGNKDYPLTLGGAGGTAGGGGLGGNGGGAIKIEASGTVAIDGKISADGSVGVKSADGQTAGGGGAGGSIWVEAQILSGTGLVSAKGGGTDNSATYFGGGGGGGRVALICTASTTFPAGNASVAFGTGSQNGQVGSLVGPGCKPSEPTVLKFYEKNATAAKVDRELFVTELTSKTALTFASDLAGTNLKLEIELRQKNQTFTNTPTNSQVTAASSKTCTGIPGGTGVTISTYCGYIEVTTGLTVSTEYKWQARIVNTSGIASNWIQFGANATSATDFTVVGAATGIVIVEGNNQSVTVGQQVTPIPKARVVDAAGYGVPYYVLTSWAVLTGGGTLANSQLTADKWGEVTAEWTIGTVAGVNNNSIKVSKTTPALSATFMASALPGAIASYQVVSQTSLSLINNPFTYTVSAVDAYNNVVPFTNNLTVVPVSSHNIANPGLGTLTPDTIAFSGAPGTVPWFNPAWNYRKKITFNNTTASLGVASTDLDNFPILIKLTAANFDFAKAQSAGEDIRITDSDGITSLAYEIEKWDAAGQAAYLWVKVPRIDIDSATDHVYVYYGNSGAVSGQSASNTWDSSYKLVQHLGETTGTAVNDSTTNNNDGAKLSATEPASGAAKIGNGFTFDGVNDYVNIPHAATLSYGAASAQFTLEAWVNTTVASGEILTKARPTATVNSEYLLRVQAGKAQFHRYQNSPYITNTVNSVATINDGQWHHVVFVNEGASSHKLYVDGVLDTTDTTTWTVSTTNTQAVQLGKYHNNTFSQSFLTGQIDEPRISGAARTATWIAATYKTQADSFVSFSGEELKGDVTTVYRDPSTGSITISSGSYTYSESIKLKVYDANGKVGYSNSILFVAQTGSCPAVVIDANQTWNAVDVPGGIFDCRGMGPFTVRTGYTLTVNSYNNGDTNYTNDFGGSILADSFSIESNGATITATGSGYAAATGPGYVYRSGVAHGGYGYGGGSAPYGDLYEPISLGSGGSGNIYGPGGAGGGSLKLITNGNMALNGKIEANGASGRWAGSGGSIWLDVAGTLSGSGTVEANGGASINDAAGPAGGRISVYYGTNSGFPLVSSNVHAYGGLNTWANGSYGGPGTVYIEQKNVDPVHGGLLVVDNNNVNTQYAGVLAGNYTLKEIRATRKGHVEFMGTTGTLTINSGAGMQGDNTKPVIKITGTLNYTGVGTLGIDGVDVGLNGKALGLQDVQIGGTNAAGLTLYGVTWFHNPSNPYNLRDVTVKGNGLITLVSTDTGDTNWADDYGPVLTVRNLTVESDANGTGTITASGKGYTSERGPGFQADLLGASHGGYGGGIGRVPYGALYEPGMFGSGGHSDLYGPGGFGGGALKIVASGNVLLNGKIEANGLSGRGGGSGGSILLDVAGSLSGSGSIVADGGTSTEGGSGGPSGGRIALYYGTNAGFSISSTNIHAYGGVGPGVDGGPGTVYIEQKVVDPVNGGLLLVNNNSNNAQYAGVLEGNYSLKEIRATGYGHVEFMGTNGVLTLNSGAGMQGDNTKSIVKITGTLNYTGVDTLNINGVDVGLNGKAIGLQDVQIGGTYESGLTLYGTTWFHNPSNPYVLRDITVKSNGNITLVPVDTGDTVWTDDYGPVLTMRNLTVELGGLVTGTGKGYVQNRGPGYQFDLLGSSHGGYGGGTGNAPYGALYEPIMLGSGGHNDLYGSGGSGGGAMKLLASGNLVLDGKIEANGTSGRGGGSGGSIWLDVAGSLSGAGVIEANGGAATEGGSGGPGGGRIALYYAANAGFPLVSANIHAYGGSGTTPGGPGTVYVEQKGTDPANGGLLIVDNNGVNSQYAGILEGTYSLKEIRATRYGHVEFMGTNGVLTINSGAGMQGDNTMPKVKITGTLRYTGSSTLQIDGVDLGLNGKELRRNATDTADEEGLQDVQVGGTNAAGITLYGTTWWHDQTKPYSLRDVTVKKNGTITLVSASNYGPVLNLRNLIVEADISTKGTITATGKGYAEESGPGYTYRNGVSHGGYGANAAVAPYGDLYEPITLGSGGSNNIYGPGGAGGGAIKIVAAGNVTVDGIIEANGTTGRWAGSGGSIWLDVAGTLSGNGVIEANGGSSVNDAAGPSGGRIAIYYGTNSGFPLAGSNIHAYGGVNTWANGAYGGPGTVYIEQKNVDLAKSGLLLIDNNNVNAQFAGALEGNYTFREIQVTRFGHVEFLGVNGKLTISNGTGLQGDSTKPTVKASGTFEYSGVGPLAINGVTLEINGRETATSSQYLDVNIGSLAAAELKLNAKTWYHNQTAPYQLGNVTIGPNGVLRMAGYDSGDTNWTNDFGPTLNATNITIDQGGELSAYGMGYTSGSRGPGVSGNLGSSHGGYGGANTSSSYGDIFEPATFGGSGSQVAGGGAMKVVVYGTLTVNGKITADGEEVATHHSNVSSGAGGSIHIDTNILAGAGTITANGRTSDWNGTGPAGGRIAIYYAENTGFPLNVTNIQARGAGESGSSYNEGFGGPGTIYVERTGVDSPRGGSLWIDNNGNVGRGPDLPAGIYALHDVVIGQNVSVGIGVEPTAQFNDFNEQPHVGRGVLFVLKGNFTLASGASINGQGKGFGPNAGPSRGNGGIGYSGGGGGANGGNGGDGQSDGANPPATGGAKTGDQLLPLSLGSGGGNSGAGALGGAGGGAFGVLAKGTLNQAGQYVDGAITIAGTINMSGEDGKTGSPGGGGGAGGSILLHGNTCDISGSLLAEGGEGGNSDVDGGSGGGGRVSILYNVGPCDVTGTVSIAEGQPTDPLNYGGAVGQVGTFPPEPNSVPWKPQYQEQFEVKEDGGLGSLEQNRRVALTVVQPVGDVLGITESSIPVGGIINGTTVTLKADAYDAGARPVSPKRLKVQVELKKVAEAFTGTSDLYDSNIITFTGGTPVILSVTINNLEMGASYKWRVRTVNVDTGLASDWDEFGNNSSDVADFTITTVANLEMVLSRTTMELPDTASITLTARNTLGNVDSSYRGTVTFSSTSSTAQLPVSYTFTALDAGIHTFTDSVKFFEAGTFIITVEDTINPALIDSASITIAVPQVPFVLISSSATNILFGSQVTITWQSALVSNTSIDQGIGSVAANGSMLITPPLGTTIYTIQGKTADDTVLTASVSIIASEDGPTDTPTDTPSETPTPTITGDTPPRTPTVTTTPTRTVRLRPTPPNVSCPSIVSFTVSSKLVKRGESVTISWKVNNADKVTIDAFSSSLPTSGSSTVILERPQDITLFARKGNCTRTAERHVEVVNAYPWEGAGGMLIGLLALETIGMQIGAAQGNLWFALIGLIDRSKKRRPWGVVYNSITKKLVPRAVVRLWDAKSGMLIDTVVTDANGIFKLTPRKGEYVLKVSAPGYTFPSKLVNSSADSGYTNVYLGEVVEVVGVDDVLMLSVPLDPVKESKAVKARQRIRSFFEELVGVISPIVLVAGFVYSVVVTMMYPLALNYLILGLYGITFLIKAYLHFSKPRLFGMVTSVDGKLVSGLEIGLFDYEFKNLISRTFTNKRGAYNFVVKNQSYYLQVLDNGYKILNRKLSKEGIQIPANPGKNGVKLVTEDLLVYPVQNIVKKK